MKRNTRTVTAFASALLLMGVAGAFADDGGRNGGNNNGNNGNNNQTQEVRLRTKLAGAMLGTKNPEGSADFRIDNKGRMRLNVEVENVDLPKGTVLTVSVIHGAATTVVGTITLKGSGEAELELNSQDGDLVPAVQKGDMITVSNGATAVLAGVF